MKPKRFISNSLPKLFAKVRDELGEDAVILSTRTLHREGAPPLIELVAAPAGQGEALPLATQEAVIDGALMQAEQRQLPADDEAGTEVLLDRAETQSWAPDSVGEVPPAWLEGFVANAPAGPRPVPSEAAGAAVEPVAPDAEPVPAAAAFVPEALAPAGSGEDDAVEAELAAAGLSPQAMVAAAEVGEPGADARTVLARSLARPVGYPADGETAVITIQGPPASGRTSALIRMALDCAEADREAILVAADRTRAGGRDQIHAYASALGLQSLDAFEPHVIDGLAQRAVRGACLFVDVPAGHWWPRPALETDHLAYLLLPAHWEDGALRRGTRSLVSGRFAGCVIAFADLATNLTPALSLAVEARLGIAFLSSGRDVSTGITPAEPLALASGVLAANTREATDGRVLAIA